MAITNTLIDNSSDSLSMVSQLKKLITESECKQIMIATGYWDIPGLTLIQNEFSEFLSKEGTGLKLLIGKDPYVYANQLKNPEIKNSRYPEDFIKRDISELSLIDEYESSIKLLLQYCAAEEDSKIQIRVYRKDASDETQFLHAKCYIFDCNDDAAYGIIGSSNFTQKGLESNAELNYLETSQYVVRSVGTQNANLRGHIAWFNEKWELSQPWNGIFLEQVLKPTPIVAKIKEKEENKDIITPYELYIKLLQHKFDELVDKDIDEAIESYLPKNYAPLNYQLEAVKQCYSIMKRHGGFFLADVVGLGKTIVGTLLIKRFLAFPDEQGRERRVLIVTPPAIQSSWKKTISDFDKDREDKISPLIEFITTGSMQNLIDDGENESDELDSGEFETELKHENYGLILIDESHKFRNSSTRMYKAIDSLISEISSDTGNYPYIGLLSATPQNNRPEDLKNQIYLFQRNHACCTLPKVTGGNLEGFFAKVNREYSSLISRTSAPFADGMFNEEISHNERNRRLIALSAEIRETILSDILVRRTRTDVKSYYKEDIEKQHLHFPEISGPHSLKYVMEPQLAKLFAYTMQLIAPVEDFQFDDSNFLCYYRYRAIEFLNDPNAKNLYKGKNMDADRFSRQLAKIMQINLVKRLESSFAAFKASLRNLRTYTKNMIDMWNQNAIFICPQIDVNHELDLTKNKHKDGRLLSFQQCADDIRAKIEKLNKEGRNEDRRNAEYTREAFNEEYIDLIRKDYDLIEDLCKQWEAYDYDPKLEIYKDSLKSVLFDKANNPLQKLVIFSESVDTATTIARVTRLKGFNTLLITAANRAENEDVIRSNFDANLPVELQCNDYQVIVTTEVLAEGINLHRANTILNYDTPWNSTRLMQRIGRVNRIGSTAEKVFVYNFMPSAEGDEEINLVQKAHTKLQSFHTLFGEDSKIFSEEENVSHYELNRAIDGEESPYSRYIYALKKFKEENPERYNYLLGRTEGIDLSVMTSNESNSFFLVTSPLIPKGLSIRCSSSQDAEIISDIDMFREYEEASLSSVVALPEDYESRVKAAELAFNRHYTKLNINAGKDRQATAAKAVIEMLVNSGNLSHDSLLLLNAAKKLINKGNKDIIKKMIGIGDQIGRDDVLFSMTQAEIDNILEDTFRKLVGDVQKKYGVAKAFIGLTK